MTTLQEKITFRYENNEIVIEGDSFNMSIPMSMLELYRVYSTGKGTGVATLKVREQEVTEDSQDEDVTEDSPTQDEEEVVEGKAILDTFTPEEPEPELEEEVPETTGGWRPYNYFDKKPWSDTP